MKSLLLSLFILLTPLIHFGDPGLFQLNGTQSVTKIPFHLFDNKIVVPVRINDKLSLNFIVDSGVSQPILLDKRWGKIFALEYVRSLRFHGAGNQTRVQAKVSKPSIKMELGDVVGEAMTLVVLNYDILNLKRFDIHGILGTQLFMRFVVKIDYPNKELLIIRPDKFTPPTDFESLDLQLVQLKPHISVSVPGYSSRPIQLLLDSGASYSMLLYHQKDLGQGGEATSWYGLGGQLIGRKHRIAKMYIGAIELKHIESILVDPDSYSKTILPAGRSGALGGAFLKMYTVIFDYGNLKLYLKPDESRHGVFTI